LNQTINILNILFIINSGALNGRLSIDALNVRRLVGDNLNLLVQSISTLICGIVIAMVADWKLSLVILFVIPLVGLQGYAQVKFLQGFSQNAKVDQKQKKPSTLYFSCSRYKYFNHEMLKCCVVPSKP